MPKPRKDDGSRNRMGGSFRSKFQRVQRIYELQFLYVSFMQLLCYCLCILYTGYASSKMSLNNLCYVTTIILRLFHALMLLWFTVYFLLLWRNIVTLLLYFYTEEYFQQTCYCIEFYQEWEYVILRLWRSWKHKIHPLNRYNNIYKYLNKTSPVSSLFVNSINEPIRSPILSLTRVIETITINIINLMRM